MLSKILDTIARRRARARGAAWLRRLDDHRLQDLGIARDQIDLFVRGKI